MPIFWITLYATLDDIDVTLSTVCSSYRRHVVGMPCCSSLTSQTYACKLLCAKVGDSPQEINPPGDKPSLAKTFFGEYILVIFLYFLIIAIRLDF